MIDEKRLIDANALKFQYARMLYPDGTESFGYHAYVTSVQIKDAPTIDPESLRPVGEWTAVDASYWSWKPDGAHVRAIKKYRHDECGKVVYKKENFCPNCGARMGGENDG